MAKSYKDLEQSYEKSVEKTISRFSERKEKFLTGSDKEVKRIYTK